jgi:hypothetical protein
MLQRIVEAFTRSHMQVSFVDEVIMGLTMFLVLLACCFASVAWDVFVRQPLQAKKRQSKKQ